MARVTCTIDTPTQYLWLHQPCNLSTLLYRNGKHHHITRVTVQNDRYIVAFNDKQKEIYKAPDSTGAFKKEDGRSRPD